MLKHEDAQKRLEQVRIKHWTEKRVAALGKLPGKLAEVGRGLLGRDASGKPIKDWQKRYKAQEAARKRLDALPAAQRQQVLATFFPKLAPYLEPAWQLLGQLPYEVGYERKAYRAPASAGVHAARGNWFDNLIRELDGYD